MVRGSLNEWRVVESGDSYTAPEMRRACLAGVLTNGDESRGFASGKEIRTSAIVSVNGRVVTTASGSQYVLGSIHKGYRTWLRKNYPGWDWRNPIIVKA